MTVKLKSLDYIKGDGELSALKNLRINKVFKLVFASMILLAVGGCDIIKNSNLMDKLQQEPDPSASAIMSERGFGKLAKGEFMAAQSLFDEALQNNPRDVYALFGKGIVLQHSGQLDQARQVFEAIKALRPNDDQRLLVINDLAPQSLRDLAALNSSLLESQGVSRALVKTSNRADVSSSFGPPGNLGLGQQKNTAINQRIAPQNLVSKKNVREASMVPGTSLADVNVIKRFETLQKLRDQGLLTPAEYSVRRNRNIGALTKLTAVSPAAGLTRSVPQAAQITQRLKAIGRALELRAITVRQHGAERTMIIDGLMPAKPTISEPPAIAPKGLMSAAEAVRRIVMLKERKLISEAEYVREKAAIEKILTPKTPVIAKNTKKTPKKVLVDSGPKPALHLASFRSKKAATRAWSQLKRAHRSLLGSLRSEVNRVNLGKTKGIYYRLIAGPFKSGSEASGVCKKLKARRQYCDAAFIS